MISHINIEYADENGVLHVCSWEPQATLDDTALEDNDYLIWEALRLQEVQAAITARSNAIQAELRIRMDKEEATELVSSEGRAEIKTGANKYNQYALDQLLKHLPQEEIVAAGAYAPKKTETVTVERKWNVAKLRRFEKRGKTIKDIIDQARIPGGKKLVISEE